ncbi:MAG: DUF3352 domain-containing protein [Candidatus Gracilibacteria bacterium]
MLNFKKTFVFALLTLALGLVSCGSDSSSDFSAQKSASGLMPEAYMPYDLGFVFSYSLLNEDQYLAFQNLDSRLGEDAQLSQVIAKSFNTQMAGLGLDYDIDLKPALGDKYRFVYGAKPSEKVAGDVDSTGSTLSSFAVLTLQDADQLETLLQTLVTAQKLTSEPLSGMDVYQDASGKWYASIYQDLFLMTNDPANLLAMTKQDQDTSLWAYPLYQDAIENGAGESIFYGVMYPQIYIAEVASLPTQLGISNVPSLIDYESLYVKAEEDGFAFDVFVKANKEKAEEADFTFDSVPKFKPYLLSEVPADGLMGYMESYGIQQSLERVLEVGDDTGAIDSLETSVRSYFGMDLQDDILSFLDKGYVLALHKNIEGIVPGISIYADVSSNADLAQTFLDKLDGQLSGLMVMLESALPGAITKDTVMIDGTTFNRLELDLNAIPRNEESPLPAVVTATPIEIAYGITDDRLLITTATAWADGGEVVSDSALYEDLKSKIDASEGLILVDANGVKDFIGTLRALREQLELGVSDSAMQLEDFLASFKGLIAKSETEAYEIHSSGYLLLAD